MTYGLSPRLFIEDGPAIQAAKSAAVRRSSGNYAVWRNLDAAGRLAMVEQAIAPSANDDSPDGYRVAL